jgi:transposase, IS5 family
MRDSWGGFDGSEADGRASFIEVLLPRGAGSNAVLERLGGLVKWYRFEKLLAHLRSEESPGYPVLLLFRALVLQSLYGLSERELEDALNDQLSFKPFAGMSFEDAAPDHTVLNRFRNRLIEEKLIEKLFAELDRQLENAGLIRSVITTPANVNDTTPADRLMRGDERNVWADAAYDTHARRARLKAEGRKPRIARRPNKHHPELPARLKRYNRLIARRRAAVETTFATLKCRMKLNLVRYIGLTKASAQILMGAIAFNMRRWAAIAA